MMPKQLQIEYGKLFMIYVLPMLWWFLGLVQEQTAWIFAFFNLVLLVGIVVVEKWTKKELGIRTDNIKESLIPYALFTVIGVCCISLLALTMKRPFTFGLPELLSVALPVSFLQEFAYRGYLIPKLQQLFVKKSSIIIINTLLFILPHLIYPEIWLHVPFIAIAGAIMAMLYIRYPNLYAIVVAHTILNFVTGGFGFFTFG